MPHGHKLNFERALAFHARRSKRSRLLDDSKEAQGLTDNFTLWRKRPNRLDMVGVDYHPGPGDLTEAMMRTGAGSKHLARDRALDLGISRGRLRRFMKSDDWEPISMKTVTLYLVLVTQATEFLAQNNYYIAKQNAPKSIKVLVRLVLCN